MQENYLGFTFDAFKGTRQLNWSKGLKKLSSKGQEEKQINN